MIHRITIPDIILRDFEKRGVFPRFHGAAHHINMSCISAKIGRDELSDMLDDADIHSEINPEWGNYPNLVFAYARFAKKGREMLRSDPGDLHAGLDMKSAAAGERDDD